MPENFRLVTDATSLKSALNTVPTSDLPRLHGTEERTQTSVVSSMLAKGYTLSNNALASARDFDEKQGISKKASELAEQAAQGIRNVDERLGVSATLQNVGSSIQQKANELGQNYQVQEKAQHAGQVIGDFGRQIGAGIQNAAQSTKEFVDASPALTNATQTISSWGQSIANVFVDAKAIAEQQQAATRILYF